VATREKKEPAKRERRLRTLKPRLYVEKKKNCGKRGGHIREGELEKSQGGVDRQEVLLGRIKRTIQRDRTTLVSKT